MKKAVVALVSVALFSSCYTQKQAEKQFNKAIVSYPTLGANFCANKYPPKEVITIEEKEVIRYVDTTSKARTNCDSLRDAGLLVDGVAEIDCPTKIVYKDKVRVEVKEVENTAKIEALNIENDSLNDVVYNLTIKNARLKESNDIKNDQLNKFKLGIGIVLGLLALFAIIKIKTKVL